MSTSKEETAPLGGTKNSPKSIIIGITGRRRVGKDTSAIFLKEQFGFIQLALADPIKRATKEIFDFTDEQLNGAQKERIDSRWGITPREVLQVVGTDLFRNTFGQRFPHIGANIWTMSLANKIDHLVRTGTQRIVVSDIRFPNEAKVIKDAGGFIIKLTRPRLTADASVDQHASETSSDQIPADFEVVNDQTIAHLCGKLELIIEKILKVP